jgi:hypothetical protein
MAKQDEPKKNLKAPSIKDKAKVVNEAPTGADWEKITVDGEEVYRKKSSSSTPRSGGEKPYPVKPKPSNGNKGTSTKPKPRKEITERNPTEINSEEYVRVVPKIKTEPKPLETPLYGEVKTYRREVPGLSTDYKMYEFPDETGVYTNKAIRKPAIGDDIIDLSKSYDANGNFVPFKTGEKLSTGTVQQINTPLESDVNTATKGVTTFSLPGTKFTSNQQGGAGLITPSTTDTYVEKKYDSLGNELPNINSGLKPLGTSGTAKETGKMYETPPIKKEDEKPAYITSQPFAKGGVVKKIKGYVKGGGVVGQNDPYAAKRAEDEEKKKKEKELREQEKQDASAKTSKQLGASAMIIGNQLYKKPTDYTATEKERQNAESLNATVDQTASSVTPWYGMAMGASDTGRSMVATDKYGEPISGTDAALNELMTASHESALDSASKGDAAGAIREITGFGKMSRAITQFAGEGDTTTGFWGDVNKLTGQTAKTDAQKKYMSDQLDKAKKENSTYVQNQAVSARESGDLNYNVKDMYDLKNPDYDENRNLILKQGYAKGGIVSKVKQMCSEGGEIKGKGTAKSDSIKAEVKEGSFVVPAENAELAKGIRKLYLKAPNKKANLKQEEGEPVKLSNGEHLFTPEENEYLESIGIELENLAPNAEEGNEKSEGGPIKGTKIDGATWDGKNWISENGSKYSTEGGKKFTNKYNQSVAKEKANEEQKNASQINVYSRKLKEATDVGNTEEAKRLQAKINELSGTKKVEVKTTTTEAPTQTTTTKPSLKAPVVKKKEVVEDLPSKDIATQGLKQDAELKTANTIVNEDKVINNTVARQEAIDADLEKKNVDYVAKSTPRKKGLSDYIGNVDPTSVVGIGQMIAGKNMLSGEVRPVDKAVIDPTYNASVDKALKEASFGLTPEQKFMAQQDIENARRDADKAGVNFSGGSGTNAYNFSRASANDMWKAKLGLSVADQDARMAKQKYADVMAADRANILAANRRQAFNDAMSTFQQKQKAGSELVGAGLQNIIGAYRFNQDQKAMDKANAERNAWTRNI